MTRLTRPSWSASGAHLASRAQQIHGSRQADQAWQQPAHAVLGDQAALGERRREDGRLGGEAQVGIERDDETQPGGRSIDRCDDEFRDRREIRVAHFELGQGATPLQCGCGLGRSVGGAAAGADGLQAAHVGAGAEAAAASRQDDRADLGIGAGPVHGVLEVEMHLVGPGIQFLGTVECNGANTVGHIVQNRVVCHLGASSCAILWSA